jgi:subtilisin family serine protease
MKLRHNWLSPIAAIAFSLASTLIATSSADSRPTSTSAVTSRYLVQFAEPALGRYNGAAAAAAGSAAILMPTKRQANGRARLDVASAPAKAYVAYLRSEQDQHLADIAAAIGRFPTTVYTMQHALNAAVLMLSPDEVQRIARTRGVAAVEADRQLELTSDIGPGFSSAASVWWGTRAGQDTIFARNFDNDGGYFGDGVVIGVIDGGYNSQSPSFQATDASGYTILNPLGHGVFLGQCHVAGISLGGCNDKIIGVYDEVGLSAGLADWVYSVEDQLGHGSHTASTAAGDRRTVTLNNYTTPIEGVAPHANLVIYRACAPYAGCGVVPIVAAIDHAIADGVVDALNFSISDVAGPWADPVAHAFLAATEAGIFVAAAAGNTCSSVPSQVAGSVNNTAPWIATVGAGTYTGGALVSGARTTEQPDELTSFSLLGPANFNVTKPDLQAPGVYILAASANNGTVGGPTAVAMMNGTSMATAHVTGSGALLLGLHPDWTALEVKSALMMAARESGLTKADGTTTSDYFDRGSGRLQEFPASNAGLVMDETADDFANADPTWGVGDPSSLNLPSMQNSTCATACNFNRTFHSTQDHTVTWTTSVIAGDNSGFSSVSVSPAKITLKALAYSPTITFRAATSALADGKFHFAKVLLTPDDPLLLPLHLTVAVAVPPA